MTAERPDLDLDLSQLGRQQWCARLDELGDDAGAFEEIGADHMSLFIDAGRDLLVTFEDAAAVRNSPTGRPMGFAAVAQHGWSLLALFCEGETWFRDPKVWATLDRLTDEGFFEGYDRVLFHGVGSCGYAAAALSVAAPGARVLLVRPHATLDPAVTGWDQRFHADRRRDFTTRYGYAPAMVDGALSTHIVQDPAQMPDAMHAALFTRPGVTQLRCRGAGRRPEQTLTALGLMPDLLVQAMTGALTPASFARLWRARRKSAAYLRGLANRLTSEGRTGLLAHLCNFGLTTRDRAFFETRLQALNNLGALAGAAE
jgi:hypothetical protein